MRYFDFANCKKGKAAFAAFMVMLLFLVTSSILGFNPSQFLMLGGIAVTAMGFLFVCRKEWKAIVTDKRVVVLILLSAVMLFPMIAKRDFQMMYLSILLGIWVAVFLSYFRTLDEVAEVYIQIMAVLGAYSVLATYILRPLLIDTGFVKLPVFYNQIGVMFHNFGLAFVSDSYVKMRNFGIFREPGVYQFFLILALFLNNYVVTWESERKLWVLNGILAVTMLTTFATGGVAELALLAVVVFFDKKLYKKKLAWVVIGIGAAVLGVAVWLIVAEQGDTYWELYSMVIGKFVNKQDSFSERGMAVFADLFFFLSHPIVGEKLVTVLHAVENNPTSTLVMYAAFGVLGGSLAVDAWFSLIWDKKRKRIVNLLLVLIMFLSFNTQNLTADVFFWLFPIMALTQWCLPRLDAWKRKVRVE